MVNDSRQEHGASQQRNFFTAAVIKLAALKREEPIRILAACSFLRYDK
jgi:hypothetical protein